MGTVEKAPRHQMTFDSVLESIGDFGRFQKRILLQLAIASIPTSLFVYQMSFHGLMPPFRCAVPGLANDTYHLQGEAHELAVNSSIPLDPSTGQYSTCHVFASAVAGDDDGTPRANATAQTACTRWVYNDDDYITSFVQDMDFVCDRRAYKVHGDMLVLAGFMVFSLFGGSVADLIGRKKCFILFLCIQTAAGTAFAFIRSLPLFLVLIFILGGCIQAIFMCIFVMVTEFMSPKWRTLAAMGTMLGWCMGLFILDLVFYLIRHWRAAQLVISLSPALLLSYWWILPESPRWLLIKNRRQEAEAVIRAMARCNRVDLPEALLLGSSLTLDHGEEDSNDTDTPLANGKDTETVCKQPAPPSESLKFWHICTSPRLVVRYLVMIIGWGSLSSVYLGVSMNVGDLVEGSLYVNFALQSFMECLAYLTTLACLNRVGRKPYYIANLIIGGLACLLMIVPILTESDQAWINLTLFCIGKFAITSALCMVYILCGELLPTVVRNSGLGMCSLLSRIISVLSPYIANLSKVIPGTIGQATPMLIFGILPLTAGLAALVLPETRNKKLPETIEDAKNFGRKVQA